jgi:hypothetical protein
VVRLVFECLFVEEFAFLVQHLAAVLGEVYDEEEHAH